MRQWLDDLARSVGFLSRLPVPAAFFADHDGRLSRTIRAFPTAGVIVMAIPALIAALLAAAAAPPLVAAAATIALQVAITGALHEDGLADTADGLGAGGNAARALEIMKDSRTGVYGVCALVLSLLMRVTALAAMIPFIAPASLALVIVSSAAFSRGLMVWHWHAMPPARSDGVAASAGLPEAAAVYSAVASATFVTLVGIWLAMGAMAALVALIAGFAASALFTHRTRARLGGHTGDTIGACQQIGEIAVLAALTLTL